MSGDPASLGPLDIRPEDFDWARFGRMTEGLPWQGRTVVITGGTGFIGARLARKLANYGATVTIPTRDKSRAGVRIDPNIRLVAWNPADPGSFFAAFAGSDTLFNLAYDVRRSGEANMALYRAIADAAARRACAASSMPARSPSMTVGRPRTSTKIRRATGRATPTRWPSARWSAISRRGSTGATSTPPSSSRSMSTAPSRRCGPTQSPSASARAAWCCQKGSTVSTTAFMSTIWSMPSSPLAICPTAARGVSSSPDRLRFPGPRCSPLMRKPAAGRSSSRIGSPLRRLPRVCRASCNQLPCGQARFSRAASGRREFKALRARLSAFRGKRGGPYRPVHEDPRFYLSRSVVHADRAAAELCPPVVDAVEGLARTKAYIAWRFGM